MYQVDLHQVQPRPERPEARRLQYRLSGGIEVLTVVVRMDLGLGHADGKYVALRVCGKECRECVDPHP